MRRIAVLLSFSIVVAACSDRVENDFLAPHNTPASANELAPLHVAEERDRVPGEYIIRFKQDVANPRVLTDDLVRSIGGEVYSVWHGMKGFWGRLSPNAVEALRRHPNIEYVEESVYFQPAAIADTQNVNTGNWGLDRIDQRQLPLDGYYIYHGRGVGVRIWIVDTGVNASEADLQGRVNFDYYTSYNQINPFAPCHPHGTKAAIIAAGSTYGVAKGATINVAGVSDDCTDGKMSSAAIANAIQFIADYSPRPAVINASFGRQCPWYGCGSAVDDAVRYAINNGVPVVVAAGNDGNSACGYSPARVSEAITVGATDRDDSRVANQYWSSNFGSCLDLFAPGISLMVGSGVYFAGTSAATPLVTGTVALYLENNSAGSATSKVLSSATTGVLSDVGSGSPNRLLYSVPLLSASVTGPSNIDNPGTYTWTASASGGDGSYSFEWYYRIDHHTLTCRYQTAWRRVGTGPAYSQNVSFAGYDFQLRLDVTSAGESKSTNHKIHVNLGDLICPMSAA